MDINGTGILQCVNLYRTYSNGRTTAVTDAGFTFHEGRFYMIRGKSGSGKSTFLRMLGGVEAPSKGKVYYCGQDLYQLPDKKLARIRGMKFGFVFQSFNLIPELTVFDNILLPCLLNGFYDRDRVYELADQLHIVGKLNQLPGELAGGQQQRTALARAMVNRPDIIFADEPTGNLDPDSRDTVMEILDEYCHRNHKTVIMVTHDESVCWRADQLITIDGGRLLI